MKKIRSHVKNGQAYYVNSMGYHEILQDSKPITKQKNLSNNSRNSAAAKTLKEVWKELGW